MTYFLHYEIYGQLKKTNMNLMETSVYDLIISIVAKSRHLMVIDDKNNNNNTTITCLFIIFSRRVNKKSVESE